jgi:hypothetical protein
MVKIMSDTSNVGNAKSAGSRLRPFEIATLLLPLQGGETVRVMDATDEQFQSFIKGAGVPVDDQGIAEWSFDDRCGIINHALKYGVALPFVEQNQFVNNLQPNKNNSIGELLPRPEHAPQAMIDIPGAPIISGWANIIKGVMTGEITTDAHPLPPVAPTGGRDYPDLEGE